MNPYRRRVVLGLGLLGGIVLVVAYQVHFRARWAVELYERQLVAAGETLTVGPLVPPTVLPENNGAPLFNRAMAGLIWRKSLLETNLPPCMRMVAPGRAMVGWAQLDVCFDTTTTNTWDELGEALTRCRDGLNLLRQAAQCPALDFQLDYLQWCYPLLPHLAQFRPSFQLLTADTINNLHRGDAATAATNVVAMLGLVRGTAGERTGVSQLFRTALAAIAMNATWELLQSPNLSDEELATLQRGWTELKFIEPARDALAMERAMDLLTLQRMRDSGAQFRQLIPSSGSSSITSNSSFGDVVETVVHNVADGTQEASWRFGSSYPDQLRALKGCQVLLESVRAVQSGQPFLMVFEREAARLADLGLAREKEDSERSPRSFGCDLGSIFSEAAAALSRIINKVFLSEVRRELTTTALALKRYQLRHDQYPAELSALVPEFLPAIPRDPADGKPLRYQLKHAAEFLLYSIGEDGVDNGGDASPATQSETFSWQRGRDLVWPTPATAEEVSAYCQRLASKRGRVGKLPPRMWDDLL
jgi:hypothetical protein